MNQLFNQIKLLTKQKRLIPPEEVITRTLMSLEEVLPQALNDSEIEKYETILFGLFYVNSGQVSFQCSIRIASCLVSLYLKQQTPKLWNLFTIVTKNPTTTGILVIGHIINKIGEHSRSMIPGLVKILVNQNIDLFSALFALNSSFKKSSNELKMYSEKVFFLIKKAFQTSQNPQNNQNSKEEASQIIAIQLLINVYSTNVVNQKKIFSFLNDVLSANNSQFYSNFVIDQICYFIAFCGYYPLKDKQTESTKIDDWDIGGTNKEKDNTSSLFDSTFELFSQYKIPYFSLIFKHFLDFLTPNFAFNNLSLLFNFVRKTQPSEISQLLYLFGHDVRGELFNEIAAEQPPSSQQQRILRSLSFDSSTIDEIAALSLQLTTNQSSTERLYGASFFSLLAEKNPQSAETYLNTSVLYISCPPEDNPTLDRDIYGMALIASHIIGATHEKKRQVLINSVSDNLKLFLKRSYESKNVYSADFVSTFMMLAVLPPSFVNPEKCSKMLSIFNDIFKRTPSLSTTEINNISVGISSPGNKSDNLNSNEKYLRNCAQYIASFAASHPMIDGNRRFIEIVSQTPSLQSLTATYCLIIAATEASMTDSVIFHYIIPEIMKIVPPRSYVMTLLSSPMPNSQELLHSYKFETTHSDIVYFKVTEPYFSYRTIEFFPNVILSLEETFASACLNELLANPLIFQLNPMMAHCLILSLLKNASTQSYIPSNFNQYILPRIDDNTTERLLSIQNDPSEKDSLLRVQVTAECASIWASLSESNFQETLEFLSSINGVGKCFLYASLVNYIQLSDSTLFQILHELNELSKVTLFCPYALFSLSTIFSVLTLRLVELSVTDMQFPFLLSIIHNNQVSLSPYNLYFISNAFIKLLPIVSPEIKGSITEPYVKLLIQAFCNTPIPYASQIMFYVLRSCFAFAKDFIDTNAMQFPLGPGTPTALQISACGAFSDMLKVRCAYNNNNFFFDLLPDLLILLHKKYDNRIVDFIVAISLHFVEVKEKITVLQIQTWTRIVKSVLSTNSLPDLQIEASLPVKRVCSFICIQILQVLQLFDSTGSSNSDQNKKDDVFEFPIDNKSSAPSSFFNECLDDLMASAARSLETEDTEIMINTYKFLNEVLMKFKDKKAVNDLPLLELYDSQFAIAIRLGFVSSSTASLSSTFVNLKGAVNSNKKEQNKGGNNGDNFVQTGQFLINYLAFHFQNLIENPKNFLTVLNGYFSGIESIKEIIDKEKMTIEKVKYRRVHAFYNIVAKISNIARLNKFVFDKFECFLPLFENELSALISDSIETLSSSNKSSDTKIAASLFKNSRSSFYGESLVSFIWLHSILHQKHGKSDKDSILDQLIEFLSAEIQNSETENWRKTAAVEAITCFIEYNNSSSSDEDSEIESKVNLIEKAVKAVLALKENNHEIFIQIIPRFLKAVGRFIIACSSKDENQTILKRGSTLWRTILDLALEKDCFDCSTVAALIGKNPQIEKDTKANEILVTKIFENGKSDDLTMALLTILIQSTWEIQLKLIFRSNFDNIFKMKLLTRILKTVKFDKGSLDKVKEYYMQFASAYFKMFRRGGMNQLASIIIDNPEVGFGILNVDCFKRICDLSESDVQNSPIFLQFCLLALEQCGPLFVEGYKAKSAKSSSLYSLIKSAMICVVALGSDPQKGREIVDISIRIIIRINVLISSNTLMKDAFEALSQREQQILTQLTEKQADKVRSRQNALNLKQFSEKPLKNVKKAQNLGEKKIGEIDSDDEGWQALDVDDGDE